jgi:hypothetical protein
MNSYHSDAKNANGGKLPGENIEPSTSIDSAIPSGSRAGIQRRTFQARIGNRRCQRYAAPGSSRADFAPVLAFAALPPPRGSGKAQKTFFFKIQLEIVLNAAVARVGNSAFTRQIAGFAQSPEDGTQTKDRVKMPFSSTRLISGLFFYATEEKLSFQYGIARRAGDISF